MKTLLATLIVVLSIVMLILGIMAVIMALNLQWQQTIILGLAIFGLYELCDRLDKAYHSR